MSAKDTRTGYFSAWKSYRKRAQLQGKHAGLEGTEGDREGVMFDLSSQ